MKNVFKEIWEGFLQDPEFRKVIYIFILMIGLCLLVALSHC